MSETATELGLGDILALLATGEMEVQGMLPWSSNYTLLVTVRADDLQGLAVYKPRRGERPLWDFPRGTLCRREVAAYLLSDALGWLLVPPTVMRDGPHGPGSVQLFIDCDHDEHLFTMQKDGGFEGQIQRLAAFDVLANNADRKSGHCLKGTDGRLWAIDHGICFHVEPKLRTVLWDYAGERMADDILADVRALREQARAGGPFIQALAGLLDTDEVRAFRRRLDRLADTGRYPDPGAGRNVPWPPV
jgi:uncharacterized repeat protein (TIGR03843 family)